MRLLKKFSKVEIRNFYQSISEVTRKQQVITSVPKRFTSFIKDVWMHQPRFQRTGRKTLRFSNNLRFRAAFDFFLLRHSIEPNLKNDIAKQRFKKTFKDY